MASMTDAEFREYMIKETTEAAGIRASILDQVLKTNGRVTALEIHAKHVDEHITIHNVRSEISKWWKDKLGKQVVNMICLAVGAVIVLILQKTNIINLSLATPAQDDAIAKILNE